MLGRKAEGFPTVMLPAAKAAERRTSSEAAEKCSMTLVKVVGSLEKSLREDGGGQNASHQTDPIQCWKAAHSASDLSKG